MQLNFIKFYSMINNLQGGVALTVHQSLGGGSFVVLFYSLTAKYMI